MIIRKNLGVPGVTSACYIKLPNYIFIDENFGNKKELRKHNFSTKKPKKVLFYRKITKEKRGIVLPSKR